MFNIFRRKTNRIKLEDLKQVVVKDIMEFTVETVEKYSEEKGKICFIAFEYFYDGEAADIGLRVGLEEERVQLIERYGKNTDVRIYTGDFNLYKPILREDKCKKNVNVLFQCMRFAEKKNIGSVYETIREVTNLLTESAKDVMWNRYATISDDFDVLGPFNYD